MSDDRLALLARRVEALAQRPVAEHPAELDEVHRGLVAELDALAAVGARAGGRDRS